MNNNEKKELIPNAVSMDRRNYHSDIITDLAVAER
jgi:hypothetical protein